jgi:hypothetical protein
MIWTLILFAHAGIWSETDSMALTSVPGFKSQAECRVAGEQAAQLASGTKKVIKFTCVKQD